MIIVDGTLENSTGLIYFPLLLVDGLLGLTTFQIGDLCRLPQAKIIAAIGQLQLKSTTLTGRATRELRAARLIPAKAIRPKFWTIDQAKMIVDRVDNKLALKRFHWLQHFAQANSVPTPSEVGTSDRSNLVIQQRQAQKVAEEKELRRNGYLSSQILLVYPGVARLVSAYSDEKRAANQTQWCLLFRPSNVVLSHMLSQKYGITTVNKVDVGSGYGRAKLYDRRVIDDFMAEHEIEKVELSPEMMKRRSQWHEKPDSEWNQLTIPIWAPVRKRR